MRTKKFSAPQLRVLNEIKQMNRYVRRRGAGNVRSWLMSNGFIERAKDGLQLTDTGRIALIDGRYFYSD